MIFNVSAIWKPKQCIFFPIVESWISFRCALARNEISYLAVWISLLKFDMVSTCRWRKIFVRQDLITLLSGHPESVIGWDVIPATLIMMHSDFV